jgi:hypothetical protein
LIKILKIEITGFGVNILIMEKPDSLKYLKMNIKIMFIAGTLKKNIKMELNHTIKLYLLMPVIIWEDRQLKKYVMVLMDIQLKERRKLD